MTSAAYPTVYAALVSTVSGALMPETRVTDGYDTSNDPGDVVMIGVPSLADTESISAGSFNQVTMTHGATGVREETGSINGLALAWNGDGDQSAARLAAFGHLADVGDLLRADPTLGLTDFDIKAQVNAGQVLEDAVDGATCAISFVVTYKAII